MKWLYCLHAVPAGACVVLHPHCQSQRCSCSLQGRSEAHDVCAAGYWETWAFKPLLEQLACKELCWALLLQLVLLRLARHCSSSSHRLKAGKSTTRAAMRRVQFDKLA